MSEYATIKRGKVKVAIGSPQFRFLMAHKLPLTIVEKEHGKTTYKRLNTKY